MNAASEGFISALAKRLPEILQAAAGSGWAFAAYIVLALGLLAVFLFPKDTPVAVRLTVFAALFLTFTGLAFAAIYQEAQSDSLERSASPVQPEPATKQSEVGEASEQRGPRERFEKWRNEQKH